MKLDLSEIIGKAGKAEEETVAFSPDELTVSGVTYPIDQKQPFTLSLKNVEERELLVSGETEVTVRLRCDRCLTDAPETFPVSIDEVFPIEGKALVIDPDEDADVIVEEKFLDIDRLVLNELLLNFPSKVLCKEDCKGICPVCGQDLNVRECGCDRAVIDPRLAKFSELFNGFKEVE